MLHTETVSPATLDLIHRLMKEPFLDNFNLVCGTALALSIGHRISVDIGLFTVQPFDTSWIASALIRQYNDV
jgi:hypothetical protein